VYDTAPHAARVQGGRHDRRLFIKADRSSMDRPGARARAR